VSEVARVGEVDAFVSHSWLDDGVEKFEKLAGWARAFEEKAGE